MLELLPNSIKMNYSLIDHELTNSRHNEHMMITLTLILHPIILDSSSYVLYYSTKPQVTTKCKLKTAHEWRLSTNWINTNVMRKYVIINKLNEIQRPSCYRAETFVRQINTYISNVWPSTMAYFLIVDATNYSSWQTDSIHFHSNFMKKNELSLSRFYGNITTNRNSQTCKLKETICSSATTFE